MKLTNAQTNWLRKLAGEKVHPRLVDERGRVMVIRSLIDKGLINREGWSLTDAGRAALNPSPQPRTEGKP